jgi:hypothetical protein
MIHTFRSCFIRKGLTSGYPVSLNVTSALFLHTFNDDYRIKIADVSQMHRRKSEPDIWKTAAKHFHALWFLIRQFDGLITKKEGIKPSVF